MKTNVISIKTKDLVSTKSNVMMITTKWWWKPLRSQYAHEDHDQDQGNKLIIQIITMWWIVTNWINVMMITTRIMIKLLLGAHDHDHH
jgi:hypothetical protein